ncbi:ATP-binding protein [Propionivibrio limicola]|uniref:ATP-binding protein n=1 Tax=Propionivibrio limicola TaxID=167645 RepID=UPI0012919492|nr:ATP-binding protein [Propionivibrio limicola]
MILAVASGKGGTGKTSISVNLARVLDAPIQLLDCDVEEPNAHLFLTAAPSSEEEITIGVPKIDAERCNACNKCVEFCQFNALASVGKAPMLFPELCHGCGGCMLVCPNNAIREERYRIGSVTTRQAGLITLKSGCLDVGVSLASTLVHAVKERRNPSTTAILDAPPGTACPAVATLRGADFAVLVTEPTPFGLNDLKLAVDTVRELKLAFGVVINRAGIGDDRVRHYCEAEGIPLLLELPDDRRIAEAYSRGELIVDALPEYRSHFERLWQAIDNESTKQRGMPYRAGVAR